MISTLNFTDTSYPAFTDMFPLVDRGDVAFVGLQIACVLQRFLPSQEFAVDEKDLVAHTIRMLVYMHCWFHGAVEDRRKVVSWLQDSQGFPKDWDMRILYLATVAYGFVSVHRQLGGVSKVKLDFMVANIMAVALQFSEENLEKFANVPKTLDEVEMFLKAHLQVPLDQLKATYEVTQDMYKRNMKSTIFTRALWSLSSNIVMDSLAPLAKSENGIVKTTYFSFLPHLNFDLLSIMKLSQPILTNFHEQLCPRFLTFEGLLHAICSTEKKLFQIHNQTLVDIFGDLNARKQKSMIDSFIPEGMTREECGLGSRTLIQQCYAVPYSAILRSQILQLSDSAPRHLAIIMDGNRRYARQHGFEDVVMGYTLGARQLMQIFPWCFSIGINCLTVWAMSSDNFRRDPKEVKGLIDMMTVFFEDFLLLDASVALMDVRIRVTGDQSILPDRLRQAIRKVENASKNNSKFNFQIAINYGGREEICMAVKSAVGNGIPIDSISPSDISKRTYASKFGLPAVDAILRTSGEKRLSGFHLWESNNAELVFLDCKWPELDEVSFLKAALDLSMRQRRCGL